MAKVAKKFCLQTTAGTSASYTVPPLKYAVINVHNSSNNASSGLVYDGQDAFIGSMHDGNGIVVPAGSSIAAKVVSGGPVLITGFEYDV